MTLETSPASTLQVLKDGVEVTIAKKKFRVDILLDGQIFLHGTRNAVYMVHPLLNVQGDDTGIRTVRSWRTDTPLLNKALEPLRFILLGDLMEDITGKKVPAFPADSSQSHGLLAFLPEPFIALLRGGNS